jgi:hypothetical protein
MAVLMAAEKFKFLKTGGSLRLVLAWRETWRLLSAGL